MCCVKSKRGPTKCVPVILIAFWLVPTAIPPSMTFRDYRDNDRSGVHGGYRSCAAVKMSSEDVSSQERSPFHGKI